VHTEALNRVPLEILRARVAQEMRTAILRGDLAPGSQLNPEELSSQLGVSREQIRQAILLLRREGLVQAQANRRAIVAPVDRQLIADVYGFREAVESAAVATLAHLRDFDVTPLLGILARGRTAVREGDLPALLHLDMSFHTTLYEAAGNQVIVEVMRGQWSHIRRVMAMVLGWTAYRQKVWDEHEEIVEAIRSGQAASASAAAERHIGEAREMLLTLFGAATTSERAGEELLF
jgi:DNA-binding GntR family transcriptional regulator